jgi:hypothetical protein
VALALAVAWALVVALALVVAWALALGPLQEGQDDLKKIYNSSVSYRGFEYAKYACCD